MTEEREHILSKDCWCNPSIVTRSGHEYRADEKKCFNCNNYAYISKAIHKHKCALNFYTEEVPEDVIKNNFDACEQWEKDSG